MIWEGVGGEGAGPLGGRLACWGMRCVPGLGAVLLAAVLGMGLTACVERDPVEQLLQRVEAAAEDRDADDLGKLLADAFTGSDGTDKTAVVTLARQYFLAWRALDIEIRDLEINRRGDSARARFRMVATGTPSSFGGMSDLVPRKEVLDMDIGARKTPDGWKLTSATWTPATP